MRRTVSIAGFAAGMASAVALLLVPGLLAALLAVLVTDGGQAALPGIQDGWDDVVAWFQGLV